MLPVAIATLIWIPPLLGLGSLLAYSGDPRLRRATSGLFGLGAVGVAGMVLHPMVSIGPMVSLAIWIAGAVALVARRRWLAEGTTRSELVAAGLALAILARAMQSPGASYDSGLYYVQAVRWITEHPLQIGLANLHGRLGFNSLWHVVAATLELPFLAGRSASFVNVLPIVFAAAAAGVGLNGMIAGAPRFSDLALAFTMLVAAHATGGIGAASPDQAAAIVVYVSLVFSIRALEADDAGVAAEARAALLLGAIAAAIKLSAAPVLIAAIGAIALRRHALPRRWWTETGILVAAALVPWMVRSVLVSGCVIYPAAGTCATELPWAVTRAAVESEAAWIRSWARTPGGDPHEVLASWAWLAGWAQGMAARGDLRFFAGTAALGGLLSVAVVRRASAAVVVPLATAALGIGYVFLAAPDPRFAFGFLHALGLVPLAFGLSRVGALARPSARILVVIAVVAASARWMNVARVRSSWRPQLTAFPEIPVAETRERITAHGVRVRVPARGDQCWGAPLPCAPLLPEALRQNGRTYFLAR